MTMLKHSRDEYGSDSGFDYDHNKHQNKLYVKGPIVDICGDQMAAIMW